MQNNLLRYINERRIQHISITFPELGACDHSGFLSLWKYIDVAPYKYYSKLTLSQFQKWLLNKYNTNRKELLSYLKSQYDAFSRAMLCYNDICGYKWHEWFDVSNEYERLKFIDLHIHSAYLRLAETVLSPLLKIIAHFLRIERGKTSEGLDIYNIVEELKGTPYESFGVSYSHIIRNAIAHGQIRYYHLAIDYSARSKSIRIDDSQMITLLDNMLDTCSALICALSIFLFLHFRELKKLPRQLLIEELQYVTRNPWWEINGCVQGQIPGADQLIIYANTNTNDQHKVNLLAFQTGVLAERYAPGFDRYFVHIGNGSSTCGWASFNGKVLGHLRKSQEVRLDQYLHALDDGTIFFMPGNRAGRITSRLDTLAKSLAVHFPMALDDIMKNMDRCKIYPRIAKMHIRIKYCYLEGAVYIDAHGKPIVKDDIRKNCARIIKAVWNMAKRQKKATFGLSFLPLGHARVGVYCSDRRRREYEIYGLGRDLICTVQESRDKRIKSPDIFGSEIEECGRFRIAWNKSWLQRDSISLKKE